MKQGDSVALLSFVRMLSARYTKGGGLQCCS